MKPTKDLHPNIICWNVRSIRMATRQEMIFEQLKSPHKPLDAIHLSETQLDGKLILKNTYLCFLISPSQKGRSLAKSLVRIET